MSSWDEKISPEEYLLKRKEANLKASGWSGPQVLVAESPQPIRPSSGSVPTFDQTHPLDQYDESAMERYIQQRREAEEAHLKALFEGENDPDTLAAIAAGMVIMRPPISDPRVKSMGDDTYIILDAPPGYRVRQFKGDHGNRYCSMCPYSGGCMMCTLP